MKSEWDPAIGELPCPGDSLNFQLLCTCLGCNQTILEVQHTKLVPEQAACPDKVSKVKTLQKTRLLSLKTRP